MKHYVIYVPGLGDRYDGVQSALLKLWPSKQLTVRYYPMNYSDGKPFGPKFASLLALINELLETGTVSLIGVSAGASVVLNAYARRREQIARVVLICGKVNNPQTVRDEVYQHNPSFAESMKQLPMSMTALGPGERSRILSLHGTTDSTVPPADTRIDGAHEGTLPVMGHVLSIGYAITLGAGKIRNFISNS